MTRTTDGPNAPGTRLLKIAQLLLNEQLVATLVRPTLADLQRELADAGSSGFRRWVARCRGYRAFWTVLLVVPFVFSSAPAGNTGAIRLPHFVTFLGVGSSVLALLLLAAPAVRIWTAAVIVSGAVVAILIHAWYHRHPSDIATPIAPQRRSPQINFSSTEVAGNIGGLIFVIGSIFIVVVGVPSVIWFLFAATLFGGLLAWGLMAWRTSHPLRGLPENRIVLR
jgi:hypothetical protein